MNILIVGAKGQLGRELSDCFARGYTAIGVPDILKQKNTVYATDIDEVDISDLAALRRYTADKKIDVIFNCAAYTDVPGCESNVDIAMRVNAEGPRNLAILTEELGAKLVHISTDYVFDGEATVPYTEKDIKKPVSVYGKSKHLGEEYIQDETKRYFIIRTAWLYSKYGKNFVKTMLRIAREKGACRVVADQRGNPTYAGDLAHHMLKLATTEHYGIYHGTGKGICSWFELTEKIVALAGIDATVSPCTSAEFPSPVKRPAFSALDNSTLHRVVGDEFRPWEEALAAFLSEYKED